MAVLSLSLLSEELLWCFSLFASDSVAPEFFFFLLEDILPDGSFTVPFRQIIVFYGIVSLS